MTEINIPNRTIFCKDNLDIIQGINSRSVDLIYLDPPFHKKKIFTAPIGSSAEGASFSDIFREEDVKDEWVQTLQEEHYHVFIFLQGVKNIEGWNSYNFCYLTYMAIRLIGCYRILKETASLYLHCDPTMSHYLKLLLDCIFKEGNFRNEIIWHYRRWTGKAKKFQSLHDTILFYTKSSEYVFNNLYTNYTIGSRERKQQGILHRFKQGEKYFVSNSAVDEQGVRENDVWHIPFIAPSAKERTGYPTQKPLALLERIIQASSNENDVVLDPFCGCATTCIAAEKLGRQWIGIDVSVKAYELVQERLKKEVPVDLFRGKPKFSTSVPKRDDDGYEAIPKKWVYVISHAQYDGEYKVGIAKNWQARLNAYQTSEPNCGYQLEYKLETEKYRELEKYIHEKFDNRHKWVRADLNQLIREMEHYAYSEC